LLRLYQGGHRSSDSLTQFGRVLGKLGHHELAIARLEEGIAQADANGAAYHALALALESAGRPVEAVAAARQAAVLDPDNGQLLLDTGRLCLGDGDFRDAVELLQTAAERLPNSGWRRPMRRPATGKKRWTLIGWPSGLT